MCAFVPACNRTCERAVGKRELAKSQREQNTINSGADKDTVMKKEKVEEKKREQSFNKVKEGGEGIVAREGRGRARVCEGGGV